MNRIENLPREITFTDLATVDPIAWRELRSASFQDLRRDHLPAADMTPEEEAYWDLRAAREEWWEEQERDAAAFDNHRPR
jgi:hypothetical protein